MNRLVMPLKQIKQDFLTENVKEELGTWKNKKKRSSRRHTAMGSANIITPMDEQRENQRKRQRVVNEINDVKPVLLFGRNIAKRVVDHLILPEEYSVHIAQVTTKSEIIIPMEEERSENQTKRKRVVDEISDKPVLLFGVNINAERVLVNHPILPEQFNIRIAQVMRRSTGGGSSSTGGFDIRQQPALVMVCEKELTKSDVNSHLNRLLIPFKILRTNVFLTADEECILNAASGNKQNNIQIRLIHVSIEPDIVNLRQWNMQSSHNYVLVTTWNRIVQSNNLNEKNTIQLWSFRDNDHNLYFVLVKKD